MKGDKGGWKEFLKSYDKKFGASLSDPARRSPDALAAFLKTFTKEDDIKVPAWIELKYVMLPLSRKYGSFGICTNIVFLMYVAVF